MMSRQTKQHRKLQGHLGKEDEQLSDTVWSGSGKSRCPGVQGVMERFRGLMGWEYPTATEQTGSSRQTSQISRSLKLN